MLHTFAIHLHKTSEYIYFGSIKKTVREVYLQFIYPAGLHLRYFISSLILKLTNKKQGKYVRLNSECSVLPPRDLCKLNQCSQRNIELSCT